MDGRAWRYTGLQLAIVGLEAIWIALAAMVLSPQPAIGVGVLAILGITTLLWNRWLLTQSWWERAWGRMVGLVGMGFLLISAGWAAQPVIMAQAVATEVYAERVAILLGSKPLLVAWLAGAVMIGRIVLLLRRQLTLERAIGRIRTSAVLTLTALALLHGAGNQFTWLVAGLVGFALVVMPLARAMELAKERMAGGMPFTLRWVGTLAVGIGLVLAIGLGADAPLEPHHFGVIYGILGVLQTIAVYLFAFLIEVLVKGLLPIVQWFMELYSEILQTVILPMLAAFLYGPEAAQARLNQVDSRILQVLSVLLVIITFALPLLLLWQFYRLFKLGANALGENVESEEEALAAAWYDWWKAQQDALRRLWAQLRRRRFGVDTVRDLYKNLLLFGDEHQLPRPSANTPYEYLEPLCQRYPDLIGEFHALTDAYVAVKYGEHIFSEAEVRGLQGAWERITTFREASGAKRAELQKTPLTPLHSE
jgi:hypothetical protein